MRRSCAGRDRRSRIPPIAAQHNERCPALRRDTLRYPALRKD